MKVKPCCEEMEKGFDLEMRSGEVYADDGCCNMFGPWQFCHFCGKRYEKEKV